MIIIGCSHAPVLAQKIAKKAKKKYSSLWVRHFPDNELHIHYRLNLRGKTIVLVQSFYSDVDSCIMEVLFAARAAKDHGAKKVILMAPYFAYMRQDAEFSPGEINSIHTLGEIMGPFIDKIYILDPHLHRQKRLSDIFSIPSKRLSSNPKIAEYIKKRYKNPLIVGPDWESYKWAQKVAKIIHCPSTILLKKRITARHVEVRFQEKVNISGKDILLVDDMISTGNTLLKTIAALKRIGVHRVHCIAVHGIFVEHALDKLQKVTEVITSNSIPNPVGKIDISSVFASQL